MSNTHAPFLLCALAALTIGCGSEVFEDGPDGEASRVDAGTAVDLSEALFRPDHILEVEITLAAADWELLRNEPDVIGMPKVMCAYQPTEKPYNYYMAEVTVDGATVSNVGVRKKGGLGSMSSSRPALKVKANEFVPGQRISGLKKLTFNNNHQDPSLISQCLGYGLFRAAGLPASRCSFAHVVVNGEDLGIYSNVESIGKDFLARHFADNSGRLYESGGEFAPGQTGRFQPKVNKPAPDCSDLAPVVTALQSSDAQLANALDSVVNLDAFMTYWAMEVLTDHWDGYANNQNNYFFYHDPGSDQFHYVPWGIDSLFGGRERTTRPYSVFACGNMPWRLYEAPDTRAMYLAKLRELITTVWDESAILAEIARMQALIEPIADPTNNGNLAAQVQSVRDFVSSRSAVLLGELNAGEPVWAYPAGEDSCRINIGTISATFTTVWDSLGDLGAGTATTGGSVSGITIDTASGFSNAGIDNEGKAVVKILGELPDGRYAVIHVFVQDPLNVTPGTAPIDLLNIAAIMVFDDPATSTSSGGGLVLNGTLTFTSANTTTSGAIVGSMTGDLFEF